MSSIIFSNENNNNSSNNINNYSNEINKINLNNSYQPICIHFIWIRYLDIDKNIKKDKFTKNNFEENDKIIEKVANYRKQQ